MPAGHWLLLVEHLQEMCAGLQKEGVYVGKQSLRVWRLQVSDQVSHYSVPQEVLGLGRGGGTC